ncbi:MAG: hypothetical protein RMK64_10035 [Rhodovarius sp.]|nr:hypothetical protein [Rhodovarius sp.]MCX7932736.1 hypothetical protein [Rhodovarius sp.]MDW8315297.1 hypothetical protein [Rhodovarius sp.]
MTAPRIFFIGFYALVVLFGLMAAAWGAGYFQFFGFVLMAFGFLSAWGVVKRHFDEEEQAGRH